MDKNVIELSKKFSESIRSMLQPEKIVLYGSYSKGNQTQESDIDIAVIFNEFNGDVLKTSADLWRTAWDIDSRIEPILLELQNDPSGFAEEVIRTGIEL